jgi:hypothetical protein
MFYPAKATKFSTDSGAEVIVVVKHWFKEVSKNVELQLGAATGGLKL